MLICYKTVDNIFLESFNLWRSFLIITLYLQTKAPIRFWCRQGLNLRFLIQPSKTLLVELTWTNTISNWIQLVTLHVKKKKNKRRGDPPTHEPHLPLNSQLHKSHKISLPSLGRPCPSFSSLFFLSTRTQTHLYLPLLHSHRCITPPPPHLFF